MGDLGATELESFRAEVKTGLADNYPAELRDPGARVDPEAMWGGRPFAGSDDPQIVWMRRVAEKGASGAKVKAPPVAASRMAPNALAESRSGRHSQSIEPSRATRAAVRPSPITA